MNGRYGAISAAIWQDRKFRKLSDGGKMLFLYLLSSPHGNMIGYFKLPVQYALHDLDLESPQAFYELFSELQEQGMAFYDQEEEVTFIRNFLSRNPFRNINQVKGAFKQLASAPYSRYMEELIRILPKGLSLDCKPETSATFWEKYRPFSRILGTNEVENDISSKGLIRGFETEKQDLKGLTRGLVGACNTEQNSNQNRTETEQGATVINFPASPKKDSLQEFKVKLSLMLFKKDLYNSEIGEECIRIYRNVGDVTEALRRIETCSSKAVSHEDMITLLQREGHVEEKEGVG